MTGAESKRGIAVPGRDWKDSGSCVSVRWGALFCRVLTVAGMLMLGLPAAAQEAPGSAANPLGLNLLDTVRAGGDPENVSTSLTVVLAGPRDPADPAQPGPDRAGTISHVFHHDAHL